MDVRPAISAVSAVVSLVALVVEVVDGLVVDGLVVDDLVAVGVEAVVAKWPIVSTDLEAPVPASGNPGPMAPFLRTGETPSVRAMVDAAASKVGRLHGPVHAQVPCGEHVLAQGTLNRLRTSPESDVCTTAHTTGNIDADEQESTRQGNEN